MLGRIDLRGEVKKKPKIYGIKRLLTTSSPAWERTDDAVNLYAEATHNGSPVRNDFDNIYPWSKIYTYSWNKSTDAETRYDEPGFNYTDDYVMTKFPEFWYKRWQDDSYEYIQIADMEVEGFTKSEEFSLGRYTISGSSSAVYSKSGAKPLTSINRTNFRTYAKNVGVGWGQLDWRYFLLQILYLVEYANYNSQEVLGQGVCNSSMVNSGGCNNLEMKSGLKSGCLLNDGAHSVIYRGIEDIFGNINQWVDGININNYINYVCYNPSEYVNDVYSGNYKQVGYTNSNSDGYVTKLGYDSYHPLISMPIAASGGSSTYMCDYYTKGSTNRLVRVGGRYDDKDKVGLWNWNCDFRDVADGATGTRLLKYK